MADCILSAGKSKVGTAEGGGRGEGCREEELGYTYKIPLSKLTNLSKLANHLRRFEEEAGIKTSVLLSRNSFNIER